MSALKCFEDDEAAAKNDDMCENLLRDNKNTLGTLSSRNLVAVLSQIGVLNLLIMLVVCQASWSSFRTVL